MRSREDASSVHHAGGKVTPAFAMGGCGERFGPFRSWRDRAVHCLHRFDDDDVGARVLTRLLCAACSSSTQIRTNVNSVHAGPSEKPASAAWAGNPRPDGRAQGSQPDAPTALMADASVGNPQEDASLASPLAHAQTTPHPPDARGVSVSLMQKSPAFRWTLGFPRPPTPRLRPTAADAGC